MFGKLKSVLGIKNKILEIMSPMDGAVIPVTESKDPTFCEEMLGKGVAIIPTGNRVSSPIDGKVDLMFDTLHAVSLVSEDGIEILIHIGMDTVKLKGKHYTAKVKSGNAVKIGDTLIEFDREAIANEGYDLTTPVVICNPDKYKIKSNTHQNINTGEPLIILEM